MGIRRTFGSVGTFLSAMMVLVMILTAAPARAQEYALQGDLEVGLWWLNKTELSPTGGETLGVGQLRADHRVYYPWGELSVRHRVRSVGVEGEEAPMVHLLDQAAITIWPVESLTVQLGRFSMPWGVAYAFFPGDAIHPVRTPRGDTPGLDGAAVTWTLTPDWGVAGVMRVDTAYGEAETGDEEGKTPWYRRLRWGAQATGYVGTTELVLAGVFQPEVLLRPSLGISPVLGPVVLHAEVALELIGEETQAQFDIPDVLGGSTGWALATGGNYSVTAGRHTVTLVGEYLYSENPPEGFGNHVLYPHVTWNWDSRLGLEQAALVDISRERALLISTATWTLYDALELETEVTYGVDQASGFSGETVALTARVYF